MPLRDKLDNAAIGFFVGTHRKNNAVGRMARHATERPNRLAFHWAEPAKIPSWSDRVETDIDLPAFPDNPEKQGIPVDSLGTENSIPMAPRQHRNVEYGVRRETLAKENRS
jgi:hypothetical protein